MKNFFLFGLLMFAFIAKSQTVTVNYSEKRIISKEKLEALPEFARKQALEAHSYILQNSNGVTLYKNSSGVKNIESFENNKSDDQIAGNATNKSETSYKVSNKFIDKWYYKDFNKNELLFNIYSGREFYGKDNLLDWNWQITNETKEINGFKCIKATSDAFGYFFTAWFTEDISINAGPEKFDGLPGLILYVGTAYYEYFATSVRIEKSLISIGVPQMPDETVTMAEVDSYVKEGMSKMKSSSTTTVNGNTTTIRTTTIIR